MPGLSGLVSASPDRPAIADAMTAAACRYPWHHASRTDVGGASFGHVRVEGAGVPQVCPFAEAGHLGVVFDGELYDAAALEGATDAERVARGVLAEGRAFLRRVHGCFTCAIWNARTRVLTLANDRFGMRPCFWAERREGLAFASEVAAVLADTEVSQAQSERGLAEFLSFGQFLGDRTRYAAIHALPAAAWVSFDAASGAITVDRYASLEADPVARTDHDWLDAIDEAFVQSVAQTCRGGGRLGLSLSGGLDARSILAVVPDGVSLDCVSLGVPGSIDLRAAGELAGLAGQAFHAHHLDSDFLARFEPLLAEMVRLTDGHYLDQGIVLTTLPSYRELGINTLLRGHAGELMHMSKAYAFSLDERALAVRTGAGLVDWLWQRLTDYMLGGVDGSAFSGPFASRMRDLARSSLEEQVREWADVEPVPQRIWRLFVSERLRRETATSLQMFRSFIELRLPFLEPRLVSLLLAAPPALKTGETIQRHILQRRRPAFAGVVNANTGALVGASRWRARTATLRMRVFAKLGVKGYQPYERLGLWLARDLQPLLRRTLLGRGAGEQPFEARVLESLITRHASRERNHTFLLMALLILSTRTELPARTAGPVVPAGAGAR